MPSSARCRSAEAASQTGGALLSSPALGADGSLYFGSLDNYVYALLPSGALKWRFDTGAAVAATPAVGCPLGNDGTVFVASYDGVLHAVRSHTALFKFHAHSLRS